MQKWEYKAIKIGVFIKKEEELNLLGDQGWELVAVVENYYFFFKRPKP